MENKKGIIQRASVNEGEGRYGPWKGLSFKIDEEWYSFFAGKHGYAEDWKEGDTVEFNWFNKPGKDGKSYKTIMDPNKKMNGSYPAPAQNNSALEAKIESLTLKVDEVLIRLKNYTRSDTIEKEDIPF